MTGFSSFYHWIIFHDMCECVCSIPFTHSPSDGHFGCFLVLAVVSNGAVNMESLTKPSLWHPDSISLQCIPRGGTPGSRGTYKGVLQNSHFWNCGGWLSSLCKMLSSCLMLKSARKQLAREDGCKCGWMWTSGDPQHELWSTRGWTECILASDFTGLGFLLGPFFNKIKMQQGGCGKVLAATGTVTASHQHAESGQRINTRAPRKGATSRPPSKPARIVLSGPGPKLLGMELWEMSFGLAKPTHCKATTRGQDWDCMEPTGLTPANNSEPSRPQTWYLSLYSGLLSLLLGFPGGSDSKESTCNEGDLGLTPGLGRSPGEGKDSPLQYSGLENSMNHIVHGIAKSQTWLSNFHWISLGASQVVLVVKNLLASVGDTRDFVRSLGQEDVPEWEMATCFSTIARKIPQDRGACQATIRGAAKSQTHTHTFS